jgi:transketolase
MRNSFAETVYELGAKNDKVAVVVADISPAGAMDKFRQECPERFISTGVAEQIMIGLCAGMALRGMRPFAYTIATFSLYRPFEFIRDDLCYQNLPVTVVGIGGGVTYSPLGGTHHSMEDIAVASAIPNMQIIAPCDPEEVKHATYWCVNENQGPVYLRLGKAGEPNLTENAVDPFVFGKIRYLKKGTDTCILSYGTIVKKATEIAQRLEKENGESVSVVSCHTLKPLDKEGITNALQNHKRVIVLEEHVPHGGLGSRVKTIAWDIKADCDVKTYSLKDEFIHIYGTHDELLAAHGISTESICKNLMSS